MAKRIAPAVERDWNGRRTDAEVKSARMLGRLAKLGYADNDDTTAPASEAEPEKKTDSSSVNVNENRQRKNSDERKAKTFTVSRVCDIALNFYEKSGRGTRSNALHEALKANLPAAYYEKADLYVELERLRAEGRSFESLAPLMEKLGTLPGKNSFPIEIEGEVIKIRLMLGRRDDVALDFYTKDSRMSPSTAIERFLREYLADEFKEAEEWLPYYGR